MGSMLTAFYAARAHVDVYVIVTGGADVNPQALYS